MKKCNFTYTQLTKKTEDRIIRLMDESLNAGSEYGENFFRHSAFGAYGLWADLTGNILDEKREADSARLEAYLKVDENKHNEH